ncbi:hypothetical protein EV292_10953 [Sphingomonas sp. BK235]|nr:hypothetical protein EV292_10953 [Sphingomonas sp. BK235]
MKWDMIRHIVVATRANRIRYRAMTAGISLPKMQIVTGGALAAFYRTNDLRR